MEKQDYKLSEKFQLRLGKFQIMPSDSNSIIPPHPLLLTVLPLTSTPHSKGSRSCHINLDTQSLLQQHPFVVRFEVVSIPV